MKQHQFSFDALPPQSNGANIGNHSHLHERNAALSTKGPNPSHNDNALPDPAHSFVRPALNLHNLQPPPEFADSVALSFGLLDELRFHRLAGMESAGDQRAKASPSRQCAKGRR